MRISRLLLVAMLALAMLIAGCGGKDEKKSAEKILRVGTSPDFAPFSFVDEKNKNADYMGFEMDLIRAIGKQMGYKVQTSNISFDGLIPALLANNIDVVISGTTITKERAEKVAFSEPYYRSGLSILVRSDENNIKKFADLNDKKIAVQIGTSSAMAASKIPGAKVREFNLVPEVIMELQNKGVDAVINDLPVSQYYITTTKSKDLKIVGELLSTEDYGVMVNKSNPEMLKEINKALQELMRNGEYNKIYEKWFGEVRK